MSDDAFEKAMSIVVIVLLWLVVIGFAMLLLIGALVLVDAT